MDKIISKIISFDDECIVEQLTMVFLVIGRRESSHRPAKLNNCAHLQSRG